MALLPGLEFWLKWGFEFLVQVENFSCDSGGWGFVLVKTSMLPTLVSYTEEGIKIKICKLGETHVRWLKFSFLKSSSVVTLLFFPHFIMPVIWIKRKSVIVTNYYFFIKRKLKCLFFSFLIYTHLNLFLLYPLYIAYINSLNKINKIYILYFFKLNGWWFFIAIFGCRTKLY